MSNSTEIEHKVVGSPDEIREQNIKDVYDVICSLLNELVKDLESFLDQKGKIDLKVLWDFLKANDPKYYLYQTYVKVKKLTFAGMDLEKVLQSGLVAVPTETFNKLLDDYSYFLTETDNLLKQIEFCFPYEKLWHEDRKVFSITDDFSDIESKEFDECVFNATRVFTATDFENQVMNLLNEFISKYNDMFEIGFFPVHRMKWKTGAFDQFTMAVNFDDKSRRPLSLHKDLARKAFYSNLMGRKMPIQSFYTRKDLF